MVAQEHGMEVIASSTHPFARWWEQKVTIGERYVMLEGNVQSLARRMVICGMHVHVGIENPDLRIDLMGQASNFLAHLLALSTSSPFWAGNDTGLKSYRLSVGHGMPRTRHPELFESWSSYQRHIDVLVSTGVIQSASEVWWDIKPSSHYPILEMRVTDVCTKIDDAIAVGTVYVCLLRMLYRLSAKSEVAHLRTFSPGGERVAGPALWIHGVADRLRTAEPGSLFRVGRGVDRFANGGSGRAWLCQPASTRAPDSDGRHLR